MKNIFYKIVILAFLLNGCARKTTTDNLTDVAVGTVEHMYDSLPIECKNQNTQKLRDLGVEQIKSISMACNDQKALLNAKINERNIIIFALSGIILLYVGVKLSSRFRL